MIAKRRMELMRITLEIIYEVVGFGRHKIRMVVKINSIKIVTHISKDNEEYIELTFSRRYLSKTKSQYFNRFRVPQMPRSVTDRKLPVYFKSRL